jgi:phosphatidylinositol glycan class Q protein
VLGSQIVKTEHSAKNNDSSIVLEISLGSEDEEQIKNDRKWECDCSILDGFLDTCKKSVVKGGNWVHFCCKPEKSFKCNVGQIPMLHHLNLNDPNVEINHCQACKSSLTSNGL